MKRHLMNLVVYLKKDQQTFHFAGFKEERQ